MVEQLRIGGENPDRPNLFAAIFARGDGVAARPLDVYGRNTARPGVRPSGRILTTAARAGATVAKFALKAIAREARSIEGDRIEGDSIEEDSGAKSFRATSVLQYSALVISGMRMNHALLDVEAAAGGCARINLRRPGSPERDVMLFAFIDHSALLARIYRNAADNTNWFVFADAPIKVERQTILTDAAKDLAQPGESLSKAASGAVRLRMMRDPTQDGVVWLHASANETATAHPGVSSFGGNPLGGDAEDVVARLAGRDAAAILSMCAGWADINAVLAAAFGRRRQPRRER